MGCGWSLQAQRRALPYCGVLSCYCEEHLQGMHETGCHWFSDGFKLLCRVPLIGWALNGIFHNDFPFSSNNHWRDTGVNAGTTPPDASVHPCTHHHTWISYLLFIKFCYQTPWIAMISYLLIVVSFACPVATNPTGFFLISSVDCSTDGSISSRRYSILTFLGCWDPSQSSSWNSSIVSREAKHRGSTRETAFLSCWMIDCFNRCCPYR